MSFFRRSNNSSPSIPPPADYNSGNKLQRPPPQDRYGSSGSQPGAAPDRYGPPQDRYGAPPQDRYGQPPDRYGAPAPDRYGAPQDRYGQGPPPPRGQQQQPPRGAPAPDRYGAAPPDRYGQNPPPAPDAYGGPRSRPNPSDPYSRGAGGDVDVDRAALFSGRNPDAPKRLGDDGPRGYVSEAELDRRRTEGGDEEEDIEGLKTSIRQTKQESLASTRNALRIAREAEETGMNTLLKLGDQSEKLGDAERHIDVAKYNSMRAADKVDELKQLNKSIFRPVIVFNKDKKRAAQEAKMLARHNDERDERERTAAEVRETQARIGNVAMSGRQDSYGSGYGDDGYGPGSDGLSAPTRGGGYRTQEQDHVRKEQRKRYQFEANASDDELEDELDDNLDGIASAVANMKKLGLAMGQEVDRQNDRLKTFERKTDEAEQHVVTNTHRLRKY